MQRGQEVEAGDKRSGPFIPGHSLAPVKIPQPSKTALPDGNQVFRPELEGHVSHSTFKPQQLYSEQCPNSIQLREIGLVEKTLTPFLHDLP